MKYSRKWRKNEGLENAKEGKSDNIGIGRSMNEDKKADVTTWASTDLL